jgi:hypothetical protein
MSAGAYLTLLVVIALLLSGVRNFVIGPRAKARLRRLIAVAIVAFGMMLVRGLPSQPTRKIARCSPLQAGNGSKLRALVTHTCDATGFQRKVRSNWVRFL